MSARKTARRRKAWQKEVIAALHEEAGNLEGLLRTLAPPEWELPVPGTPWTVRDLVGHLTVTLSWIPRALMAPAPARPEVSAAEHYRSAARRSPTARTARLLLARSRAAAHPVPERLTEDFTGTWHWAHTLCRAEPAPRLVHTRHGDAMLLSDYLLTHLADLVLHGLDLAAALARPPRPTHHAARLVDELLREGGSRFLEWDGVAFLHEDHCVIPFPQAERLDGSKSERFALQPFMVGRR